MDLDAARFDELVYKPQETFEAIKAVALETLASWERNDALLKGSPPTYMEEDPVVGRGLAPTAEDARDDEDDEAQSEASDDSLDYDQWRQMLTTNIEQMMFVSGETAEPSAETTTVIEQIVREQVVEMLTQATALAARRGVRSITTDDLIFLIRHDKTKVSRLRTFLSWKDVRKNVRDSEDKGVTDNPDFVGGDDATTTAVLGASVPVGEAGKKNKKVKVGLPWDIASFYSEQVPEGDDEEDEDEEEMNLATLQRLKNADDRTSNMTREEYRHWSECRQASFTFRKGKRFREWAGFGVVTDGKPSDDIIDILGFLTFEIVQTLTEMSLKVKLGEETYKRSLGVDKETLKRKRESGLFDLPEERRSPIEPRHVREAFRLLQNRGAPSRPLSLGRYALVRIPLKLI
ncbi:MAG: Transcription initiation protein spt3 [Trizodia sp. TS-e1964]|nr:MAG: Transcription initiation protein spt3 [Trizodia sp. TS-e1964]